MGLRTRKHREKETQSEKTIEISAEMQGSLVFKDPVNLKINGHFNGSLNTQGTLTIGEQAVVKANINGENVLIEGHVTGDITANTMLVLLPKSTLTGNIITPKLNIVEGAIFQGRCQMQSTIEPSLGLDEVASYLEIDINEIEQLANSGKIPAQKTGEDWRFEKEKIDLWASSGKVQ
jgi:excisionase family DNA binding protein